MRIAVEVASDPGAEPWHDGRLRRAPAQLAEQIGCGLPEALLEEPEPVPDLVDDMRAPRAQLVGLPEDRHLLREAPADPLERRRRQLRRVELAQELGDPPVPPQDGAPRRLRRMRCQHELDGRIAGRVLESPEPLLGVGE